MYLHYSLYTGMIITKVAGGFGKPSKTSNFLENMLIFNTRYFKMQTRAKNMKITEWRETPRMVRTDCTDEFQYRCRYNYLYGQSIYLKLIALSCSKFIFIGTIAIVTAVSSDQIELTRCGETMVLCLTISKLRIWVHSLSLWRRDYLITTFPFNVNVSGGTVESLKTVVIYLHNMEMQ